MSKAENFIKNEKDIYGKIYIDIAYAIDNITPFLDKNILRSRKYYTKIGVLKKYMDLLDSSNSEIKRRGFMSIFSGNKFVDLLKTYRHDNIANLSLLKNCSSCQCLNCIAECKFDSCKGCSNSGHIAYCDHTRTCVYKFSNYYLDLDDTNTGITEKVKVLAIVQDALNDKRYIIVNQLSSNEKFIMYYYPSIKEDSYGEIFDENDLNFAADAYENIEL